MNKTSAGSRRIAIALAVVGFLVPAWLGLRLVLPEPVLAQVGGVGQSCLVCRQTAWGDTFTLSANNVTRIYRFTRDATAQLEFGSGTVRFDGTPLVPGCHLLTAQEEELLQFEGAGEVRVDVPAPADGCP